MDSHVNVYINIYKRNGKSTHTHMYIYIHVYTRIIVEVPCYRTISNHLVMGCDQSIPIIRMG